METILDMVTAKATGEYITTLATQPMLGETLFPNKKLVGLDLKYLVGYKGLPVALKPSALGSRAFTRDRVGASEIQHELPFFREQMIIDERQRQKLMRAKMDASDPYTSAILAEIFDDAKTLYDGAKVQGERLRMQVISSGKIAIKSANKDGNDVNYEYNYDESGEWAKKNKRALTGAAQWKKHDSSDPIADLLKEIDRAKSMGVQLSRAIMSPATWADVKANANVRARLVTAAGTSLLATDSRVKTLISEELGLSISVYELTFKDENGKEKAYFPDGVVSLLPAQTLGFTHYGTTPEEADLMAGYGDANVQIVDGGIAITVAKEYGPPVVIKTVVSELVLPSFEQMASVFVLAV